MSESSSSPPSSPSIDGLNFILEDDSDDTEMLKCMVDDETELKTIQLLMEWRQRTQANMASSSSRRPKKKKRFIRRDWEAAHDRLYRDYFIQESMYNEAHFRRRFRMRRHVFTRIVDSLSARYDYFQQRYDGLGRRGLSRLTKSTAAMRMLAYGIVADSIDEYLKIWESNAFECLKNFCAGVVKTFGQEYLRKLTQADVDHLLAVAEARDFSGMLGSVDCMHWKWKNCPSGWK